MSGQHAGVEYLLALVTFREVLKSSIPRWETRACWTLTCDDVGQMMNRPARVFVWVCGVNAWRSISVTRTSRMFWLLRRQYFSFIQAAWKWSVLMGQMGLLRLGYQPTMGTEIIQLEDVFANTWQRRNHLDQGRVCASDDSLILPPWHTFHIFPLRLCCSRKRHVKSGLPRDRPVQVQFKNGEPSIIGRRHLCDPCAGYSFVRYAIRRALKTSLANVGMEQIIARRFTRWLGVLDA